MIRTMLLAAAIAAAAPATAATVAFTGAMSATGGVGPDPTRATVLPANSSGSSNLGAFTYGQTLCTAGGPGPFSGTFTVFFASDEFSGTFDGLATPSGTPGLINESFTYLVTAGTGRFLGASGTFTGLGTLDARNPPPHLTLDFSGDLDLPAVPEPATWAMMIAGFGMVGAAARRSKAVALAA